MAFPTHGLSALLLSSIVLSGCAFLPPQRGEPEPPSESSEIDSPASGMPSEAETVSASTPQSEEDAAAAAAEETEPNYFSRGVVRAESAVAIGQTAQSPDDWDLAAGRWEQAVLFMQQVPSSDPNYSVAQQKVKEYGQNLEVVRKRASEEVPLTATAPVQVNRPPGLVATIPVVKQMGGTPVVPVTLKGSKGTQQVDMLFDTGASGTLITPSMASAVGVIITGSAVVTVADGRQVEIPVGYVDTLQVGNLVVKDLWVGIGGDIALLGQDVYGEYGLSIGKSQIDLYE